MWTAATILIRRSHDGRRRSHLRNASPSLSGSLPRSIAGALLHQSPTAAGDRFPGGRRGNATAGTERQDLQRLWKNPTDISKWSFLIRQRICREGQASFSRPHSRLATLSLTVKSDPQRPERARPATSRVARSESRAGRTSRKSEGGTREEGPNDDRS